MATQAPKYTVGTLTLQDYVWGVEVAAVRMLTEELKRPELINREQLYFLVHKMIEDQTAFIVKCDDKPVGAIGALLLPNTFNPQITSLVELVWYVLPEYRSTRAGALLFKAYEDLANARSDEVTLSLIGSSTINHKNLERKGFKLEEYSFRKQIKDTTWLL